jgi:hypothetical protein
MMARFEIGFLFHFADTALQGPSLVIMRSTNGFTFGGYASVSWNSTSGLIPAAGSFVFWVENPQGRAPGCLDCVKPEHALHGGSHNGPFFQGQTGCVAIGASNYSQPTPGYPDTTGLGVALFTGSANFTPDDYEVWAVA